jgi:hypothetical protein
VRSEESSDERRRGRRRVGLGGFGGSKLDMEVLGFVESLDVNGGFVRVWSDSVWFRMNKHKVEGPCERATARLMQVCQVPCWWWLDGEVKKTQAAGFRRETNRGRIAPISEHVSPLVATTSPC